MADKTKDGVAAALEKIDTMPEPFMDMGKRLHEVIILTDLDEPTEVRIADIVKKALG